MFFSRCMALLSKSLWILLWKFKNHFWRFTWLVIFQQFQIPQSFLWSENSGCFFFSMQLDWQVDAELSVSSFPASKPLWCFSVHHWLVNTVQRSPFLKNTVLTTGDSNFAIWRESVLVTTRTNVTASSNQDENFPCFKWTHIQEGPIILSPNSEQMCTAACWSPSRPAVFYIGKEDGRIEVWNLLEKTSEPAFVQEHITNAKITCIKPWMAFRKLDTCNTHVQYLHYTNAGSSIDWWTTKRTLASKSIKY